jgi:hypothetical protein
MDDLHIFVILHGFGDDLSNIKKIIEFYGELHVEPSFPVD